MRKLGWTLLAVLGVFCLSSNAMAATVQLADYMSNADFDASMTGWGDTSASGCKFRTFADGETVNSWTQAESDYGYYVQATASAATGFAAHSGSQYVMIHAMPAYTAGDISALATAPNVGLRSTDTYAFNVQLRKYNEVYPWVATSLKVWVDAGAGLTEVAAVDGSQIGAEWSEFAVSFSWAGVAQAAGEWNLVLGVERGTGGGEYDAICIDSITVPEPTTLGLLAMGLVVMRQKRR